MNDILQQKLEYVKACSLAEFYSHCRRDTSLGPMKNLFLAHRPVDVARMTDILKRKGWIQSCPERLTREWKDQAVKAYIRTQGKGWATKLTCPSCELAKGLSSTRCKSCSNKSESTKARCVETSLARYGTRNPMQAEQTQEKFRATMRERYGVSYSGESKELLSKSHQTYMQRTGYKSPASTPEFKEAHLERYQNAAWVRKVTEKTKATKIERYGDDWNGAAIKAMIQARYKVKKVVLQGITHSVLGYEPVAIKWLVEKGVKESAIHPNPQTVPYQDPVNKRNRQYHPDIEVRTRRGKTLVEVKSTYTAGLTKGKSWMWKILQAKANGVREHTGKPLKVLICSDTRVLCVLTGVDQMTRKEALHYYESTRIRSPGRKSPAGT